MKVGRSPPPIRARGRGVGRARAAAAGTADREEPVVAAIGRLVDHRSARHRADGGVRDTWRRRSSGCSAQIVRFACRTCGSPCVSGFHVVPPSVDLKMPAAGAAESRALDETLLLLPERGIHDVRIARIDPHVVAARVLVLVEHLLERPAAVRGSEDAALRVRPVGMAERRDEDPVRVAGVDVDHRDHLAVEESEVRPGPARVGRLVDAVAGGEIGPDDAGAGADVDDVADPTAPPRWRRSSRWTRDRRSAASSSRSRSNATRRRCRSRRRRRCGWLGTPASARARPARIGPICRQCIAAPGSTGAGGWGGAADKLNETSARTPID